MKRQYHLPLPQNEAMSLEDFLPSAANEEAVRWLLQTPPEAWPSHALVLCGPEGSGKTHLLTIWCEQQDALRVHVGDPGVLSLIVSGTCVTKAFALDDADQVVGVPDHEEWLQHFYNATKEAHMPFLMTASKSPSVWGLGLRDIETRLKSCACAALHEPDDDLARGLFLKLFGDRQLMVETGVVNYLVARVERTGTAIKNIVALLDEASLETGRKISIPFVQKILTQHAAIADTEKQ